MECTPSAPTSLKAWSRVAGSLRSLVASNVSDWPCEAWAAAGTSSAPAAHTRAMRVPKRRMRRGTPQEPPGDRKGCGPSCSGCVEGACDTVALGFAPVSPQAAPDDVVRTHAEGEANEREPLLVLEPLTAFLDAPGLGSGEDAGEPTGDGHSSVTYALRRDGADVDLRRPPRGPLPPSAHDVLREA